MAQSRDTWSPAILDLLMAPRIHITTAIIYSNGPPHVGHAYELLATDAFARFQRRMLGAGNVTFVTGTDEHGDKNKRAAEAAGLHPKAFADKISTLFRDAWAGLDISYDGPSGVRAEDARAQLRMRRHLLQGLRRPVLRGMRALLHREGTHPRQHLSGA
jgi:leucyl-tRNA synthetase